LEMRREIRTLQQTLGITMVYVTHDQSEAMSMADQVILLRDGRIEQDGSPTDLYTRPATAFTARFIGTPPMNVLTVADAGGAGVVAGTDGPSVLTGRGAGLLLGVRPEDIELASGHGVDAVINAIEYLGADSIVSCTVSGQSLAVRAPRRVELPIGARIKLAWGKDAAHVFDAETGRRRDDIPVR